jgi:hypothetical protein
MAIRAAYDDDFFNWTQEQAALLRDLPRDVRLPNSIDLAHIAEEIEDMGKSELTTVKSFLGRILEHLIKIAAKGLDAEPARHWGGEIITFHRNAVRRYTPGMRQLIDVEDIWREAKADTAQMLSFAGESIPDLPDTCPFTLDDLLGVSIDVRAMIAAITQRDQA